MKENEKELYKNLAQKIIKGGSTVILSDVYRRTKLIFDAILDYLPKYTKVVRTDDQLLIEGNDWSGDTAVWA